MLVERILIKKMTNEDINDILVLEEMCFTDPWSYKMFESDLSHSNVHYFVAINNGKKIGYAGFWQILDEGHITNICVDKNSQNNGIGTKIMSYMIDYMKSLGIIATTLEVRKSNFQAIKFYEKLGFKQEGNRKGYYSKPVEDAVIMWKHLM